MCYQRVRCPITIRVPCDSPVIVLELGTFSSSLGAVSLQAVTGCEDCLAALLDHDAFVLCRDFKGRTPIHFASVCGHSEILRTLLQAALSTDPLDSVVDYSGYSPMHWASYSGKTFKSCAQFLRLGKSQAKFLYSMAASGTRNMLCVMLL